MNLADRITEYVPKFSPEMKQLLDAMLAAGNEIIDVEVGCGVLVQFEIK